MRTRSNGKKWLLCWKRLLPWCIAEHAAYLAQLGSHTKPALREPLPPAVQTEHGDSTLPAKTISLDEQTGPTASPTERLLEYSLGTMLWLIDTQVPKKTTC
eukprot:m.96118 g.96118  ORF g.96118 m.96118 type:complete len:101 (+) comp51316_c0_seq5:418-720(+)